MTADDEVLVACYTDGRPLPLKRAAAILTHRSYDALSMRAENLRKRGLIPYAEGHARHTDPAPAPTAAPTVTTVASAPQTEVPMRCPHCERPVFPSDLRPFRGEA